MKQYKSVEILPNFQNGEPNSYNHLGAFNVTYAYFTRKIFISSSGKRVATWPSGCGLTSLRRHIYYIGAECLFLIF